MLIFLLILFDALSLPTCGGRIKRNIFGRKCRIKFNHVNIRSTMCFSKHLLLTQRPCDPFPDWIYINNRQSLIPPPCDLHQSEMIVIFSTLFHTSTSRKAIARWKYHTLCDYETSTIWNDWVEERKFRTRHRNTLLRRRSIQWNSLLLMCLCWSQGQ